MERPGHEHCEAVIKSLETQLAAARARLAEVDVSDLEIVEPKRHTYHPQADRIVKLEAALAEVERERDEGIMKYTAQAICMEHERNQEIERTRQAREERDAAIAECRKRKGWDQDIAYWKARCEAMREALQPILVSFRAARKRWIELDEDPVTPEEEQLWLSGERAIYIKGQTIMDILALAAQEQG